MKTILLLGLKRSGKSSIKQVVFHKMNANETLFLSSDSSPSSSTFTAFHPFTIVDIPQNDLIECNIDFSTRSSIIYVIDAQDDYIDAIQKLFVVCTR